MHDGVLYFPSPSDVTTAFDAATGKKLWEHRRALPADLGQFVPFPQTNRNLAIYDRLIIDNGADDFVYALDAATGKLVWETKILDYKIHHVKQGSAPLVANGVLIAGRNCQPNGGPDACIITGHDARTGKELWRKRTIPKPGEPGGDSWGDVPDDERWHVGAWMIPSYDPELDLVYVGTSVTAPAPKFMLAGNDKQYLYHNSTLALRPATGETVWYYQHAVDHWDLDHPFERILVDTVVAPDASEVPWINPRLRPGEERRVVTGIPGKTGLVYTLDRATGEFLWARPTITQNVIERIDGATGAVTIRADALFTGPDAEPSHLPDNERRQELARGRLQPAHEDDVLRNGEHLRVDDFGRDGDGDARDALRDRHRERDRARRRRQGRHAALDLRGDGQGLRGATTSARRSWRCSRRAATSCSAATWPAYCARSTPRQARCSGRRASARRSRATP